MGNAIYEGRQMSMNYQNSVYEMEIKNEKRAGLQMTRITKEIKLKRPIKADKQKKY